VPAGGGPALEPDPLIRAAPRERRDLHVDRLDDPDTVKRSRFPADVSGDPDDAELAELITSEELVANLPPRDDRREHSRVGRLAVRQDEREAEAGHEGDAKRDVRPDGVAPRPGQSLAQRA
jgi:hypothetical protein